MNTSNTRARLRMTASERVMGRFMRAPDHSSDAADEFKEFEASGEVEIGDSNTAEPEAKPRRAPKKVEPQPEAEEGDDQEAEEEGDDQETGSDEGDDQEDDQDKKPKKSAREHQIERLKREKAELARQLREAEQRGIEQLAAKLEALENRLQGGKSSANEDSGTPAPDPTDTDKYPLGHLDDRYIEDRIEWAAEKKAAERADAVLQRQQEIEQTEAQQQQQIQLLEKVDDLATRGSEIYDDFQESVVETGMRGDWDLTQTTFEAAAEAENGVQILYALAQDPKEASRVAKLSAFQQLKYVAEKDAEIGKGKSPRRIPRAGEPPKTVARGANSRTQINPATDNLDDFEKAWEADARKGSR